MHFVTTEHHFGTIGHALAEYIFPLTGQTQWVGIDLPIMATAVKAILGAAYLDGGMQAAHRVMDALGGFRWATNTGGFVW